VTHPIPDEALDSDIAIIARKGSGKSYLARGLAERLLDLGRRIVVIDPLGAWWGLRSAADGEGPGYPVAVFGGEHADMPLSAAMGEPLARLISAENLPCVIDTSLMRKEEQGQLAIDLFEGLFRFNRDALTIILEEADVFAPQNPTKDGYAARVLHEVDRIARRGRARGLRLITLTQRPARLHKDVLSQAATLVAMRLSAPQDRDAIKAWVEGNADRDQANAVMDSLASLPVGTGWVWAPDLGVLSKEAFPAIKTLDTSATPKAGETRVQPKTLAQVDVSAIRAALQVVEVEAKPAGGSGVPAAASILAAEQSGYRNGYEAGRRDGLEAGRVAERHRMGKLVLDFAGQFALETQQSALLPPEPATQAPRLPKEHARVAVSASPSVGKLVSAILAAYPRGMTLATAAKRAGLSKRSSAFRGYLRQAAEDVRIKDSGDGRFVALEPPVGIPQPSGLADFKAQLPPSQAAMLTAIEQAGDWMDLDAIAERASISRTSSGLASGLRELVALDLAERQGSSWRLHPDFGDLP
jgi:hypothetical protein